MKNGGEPAPKRNLCPPILSTVARARVRDPNQRWEHFRSGRMSLPLFIERRLLCAHQIGRQGNPP